MWIFFLSFFLWSINADLVIRPSEQILIRDQFRSFVALCSNQSKSQVYGWRSPQRHEIPSNENDRVTIERQLHGIRLRIRNLTIDDQGTWQCFGSDEKGQPIEKSFEMNIRIPITFYGDSIQYAALGESVLIQCRIQANPTAEITWFKGSEKNRLDDANYQLVHDGLRINRVEMSNNDTYWCRADVLETGESRDYPISVIVSKPISETRVTCAEPCAIEKKTATLICEASGLPSPKYLWYYGSNSPVGASELPKFVVRGNQLTINYVDETDNGKYTCHAFNEFDRQGQRAEYNLNVIVPPRLSPMPPMEITLDPQQPQRVSFTCRLERGSTTNLTLQWFYANETVIETTSDMIVDRTHFETHQLVELRFEPVRREHFGNYTCLAKNLADRTFATANLYIQFAPIYVGNPMTTLSTLPNYRSTMRCLFESYPTPQIQWIKLSRTVQDPEGRILAVGIDNGVNEIVTKQIGTTLYESILSYTPTERDFGLSFECRALNPRLARHAFTLQRAQPPKKVNISEVKPSATNVDILVQSSDHDDLPLIQYVLKYDLEENSDNPSEQSIIPAEIFANEQRIRIENLRPSTNYYFILMAESQAGVGQATEPIPFRTLDRQRPDFIIDNSSNQTCSNDQTCLISWTMQSDGGAPLVRAEISYVEIDIDGDDDDDGVNENEEIETIHAPISIDPTSHEYELTGLKSETTYLISVKFYNEAGMTEQRLRIRTPKENSEYLTRKKNSLIIDSPKNQPSKWAIIGVILTILLSALVFVSICITLRVCRVNRKDTTIHTDHQTTPMMNGDEHSDKTNGHTQSNKFDETV